MSTKWNPEFGKAQFIELLMATKRPGMDNVIKGLEKLGFFDAPASTKFHSDFSGGLLYHSLQVYEQAMKIREIEIALRPWTEERLPVDSVTITALLHDVCKSEIYKVEFRNRKNDLGQWERYQTWKADYAHNPLGHGEKSVIRLLQMGLELRLPEILAISWHMGAWDLSSSHEAVGNFNEACDTSPLVPVIMAADQLASRISEHKEEEAEDGK